MTNKYGARTVEADGYKFASRAEHRRYEQLRMMAMAGEIRNLEVHPRFALYVPVFEDCEFAIADQAKAPKEVGLVNGSQATIGRLIGHYTADFSYTRPGAAGLIVEDCKGGRATVTEAYRLRKRMVEALYSITVVEVQA